MSDLSQNNGSGAITLTGLADCQIFESFGKDPGTRLAMFAFRALMSGSQLDAQVPAGIIRADDPAGRSLPARVFPDVRHRLGVGGSGAVGRRILPRAECLTGSYFRQLFSDLER